MHYTINPHQFTTIKSPSEYIFKEKGSEFIARAFPVESEEEFQQIHNDIKKRFYDASHHCFAFRLVGNIFKYSDDGEPNGTAGVRILNAIDHFNLNQALVIVTRYFGGVKLGVGPLGKAYFTAAENVLELSPKIIKNAFYKIIIITDFSFISRIHRILAINKARIINTNYDDKIKLECLVEQFSFEELKNTLLNESNGTIEVKNTEKTLFL